jgi:hypothetical protein
MIRCFLGWRLLTQARLGIHPFQQADPRLDQFHQVITCGNTGFDEILPQVKNWWTQWQSQLLQQKSVDAIEVTAARRVICSTSSTSVLEKGCCILKVLRVASSKV